MAPGGSPCGPGRPGAARQLLTIERSRGRSSFVAPGAWGREAAPHNRKFKGKELVCGPGGGLALWPALGGSP